jgi:hypothetical protein
MARARRPDPVRVLIGLEVSEADAARIDQVLARPEFAEWTRAQWCHEIVRTALRYYVGDDAEPDTGPAEPSVAEPSVAEPPSEVEPPVQVPCSHPPDARDYQTGACAACGAILWD